VALHTAASPRRDPMLERQERRPQQAHIPPMARSVLAAGPAQDAASNPVVEDAATQPSMIDYHFGSISILPPEPHPGPEGGALSPAVDDHIKAKQGGGAPLAPSVRGRMEGAFGHPFADVRIHADGESDRLNRSVGASAFTLGTDIFLSHGATGVGSHGGDTLLA